MNNNDRRVSWSSRPCGWLLNDLGLKFNVGLGKFESIMRVIDNLK